MYRVHAAPSVFPTPELLGCAFARTQIFAVESNLGSKTLVTVTLCSSIARTMTVARIANDTYFRGLTKDVLLSCQQDEDEDDQYPPTEHQRTTNSANYAPTPVSALVKR